MDIFSKNLEFNARGNVVDYDLLCFSHLRWNFVFQRPQHLMSLAAKRGRVFFIEEPIEGDGEPSLEIEVTESGVTIVRPSIPERRFGDDSILRELVNGLLADRSITKFVKWYYTPMMLPWTRHLPAMATVYDCMDELSAFKNAPPELKVNEAALFKKADLVFTGGRSLYNAKKSLHSDVHLFASSIDVDHFAQARQWLDDPADQETIAFPRAGYVGVIDERFDRELLAGVADLKPDWQFVVIGPVVKISESDLPRRANIHYLGSRLYKDLPEYLAGWQVAIMPFAINEATRFISPTKTPEYLAAGLPVVSTAIHDVVDPYGKAGLVHIAATAQEFDTAIEKARVEDIEARRTKVAQFLSTGSWKITFSKMEVLIRDAIAEKGRGQTRVAAKVISPAERTSAGSGRTAGLELHD